MPELPEVETVCNELNHILRLDHGQPVMITSMEFKRKDLRKKIPKEKLKSLVGQPLDKIRRRAKFLLFPTAHGTLINHLGMTGHWRVLKKGEPPKKHDHALLSFSNGVTLIYNDPRRFGLIDFAELEKISNSPWLKHLGVEPLSEEFDGDYFYKKIHERSAPIKNVIMDQKLVVGVGNIYASEALFLCGIHPFNLAHKISKKRADLLVDSIKAILLKAIHSGGSTIRDFRSSEGNMGYFAQELKVYGRKGQKCRVCNTPIKSKVLAGRNTFWCPKCQKK